MKDGSNYQHRIGTLAMVENLIKNYWPQLTFVALTLIGFGKGWQSLNVMFKTLEDHSKKLQTLQSQQVDYCTHIFCEKYRDSCASRNDKRFDELKNLLQAMDGKRETGRDDMNALLADVSCRLGRIEGKLEK